MPRSPLRFAAAALLLCGLAAPAFAQLGFSPRAKIVAPRIGFQPGGSNEREGGSAAPVRKAGLWSPVTVAVEYLDIRGYRGGISLEISTTDCDGMTTVTRTPIIPKLPDELPNDDFLMARGKGVRVERGEIAATAYVRLAGDKPEVKLRLVEQENPDKGVSDTDSGGTLDARKPSKYVILTLGTVVKGLGFPANEAGGLRGGRVEIGKLDTVEEMPDQWFGYEAADLVILPTGRANPDFMALFTSDSEKYARKRRALFEWVRRGGKLVVSAADKADQVAPSLDFAAVLPAALGPMVRERGLNITQVKERATLPKLAFNERVLTRDDRDVIKGVVSGLSAYPAGPLDRATGLPTYPAGVPDRLPPDLFPVVGLKPPARGTPFTKLLEETDGKKRLLAAQAPLGLGRITLLGFDLDREPFSNNIWGGREAVWEWLVTVAGDGFSDKNPQRQNQVDPKYGTTNYNQPTEDGAATALRASVDHYDQVPVISFGWVALFILGYTLIIGPIEYVLLKKLLGKLELTWITFPIIVLSVSGAAYLTAYAVKGKDLRMNKIDVMDVDLRTDRPRVYGRSWFTIFSPRIATYTIGVEPKESWAKAKDEKGFSPVTTVDWFGVPKSGGGSGGGREYKYDFDPAGDTSPRANGLTGVPILVWGTKAFTANWSGVIDPTNPPAVSTLAYNTQENITTGEITFNATVNDIEQAYAVYAGKVYAIPPSFSAGTKLRFRPNAESFKPLPESPLKDDPRFTYQEQEDDYGGGPFGGAKKKDAPKTTAAGDGSPIALNGLLFHGSSGAGTRTALPQNASLRALDQSWRMTADNKDEVMLVFKVKRASGGAEDMMTDPAAASPSRVWLGSLPGRDQPRAPVEGVLQQDTVLRLYLPVKPAAK